MQCKTASLLGGVVVIRSYSSRRTRAGMISRPYTADEIDAIAAYCPAPDRCYLVPVALVDGHRVIHLRLAPCKNNQQAAINWAAQYELGAIAQLGERPAGSREVVGSSPTSSISAVGTG